MVLQDSTSDTSTSDSLSDPDPYGEPTSSSQLWKYHIPNVPVPNAIASAISGITTKTIQSACGTHIDHAAQALQQSSLQRLPTQTEAEALAQHCATALVTASYGKPLGYTVGLYRAYVTRKAYRFPFRTPDPKTFDPSRFTIFGATIFQGQQARVMWHVLRCTAYGVGMAYLGHLIFGISGAWKLATGQAKDDRLKDVMKAQREAARARFKGELERMKKTGSIDNKDANEVLKTSRERQAQESMQRKRTAETSDWDDASPSAAGWDDFSNPTVQDSSSFQESSNNPPKMTTTTAQQGKYTRQKKRQETEQAQYNTSADSLLSDFEAQSDDATNSAPSSTSRAPTDRGSSNESAWARIRRENSSSNNSETS